MPNKSLDTVPVMVNIVGTRTIYEFPSPPPIKFVLFKVNILDTTTILRPVFLGRFQWTMPGVYKMCRVAMDYARYVRYQWTMPGMYNNNGLCQICTVTMDYATYVQ